MLCRIRRGAVELAVVLAIALSGAAAADDRDAPLSTEGARQLQLEVTINGTPMHLIGSFLQLASGRVATMRSELTGLGLKVPGPSPDDLVVIDTLQGLTYRYDEAAQKIALRVDDSLRPVTIYDAHGVPAQTVEPRSDYGAVLNYDLFVGNTWQKKHPSFTGANAAVEGRFFGPFGLLDQSAILNLTSDDRFEAIRLDTTWSYADPDELVIYRAGDVITGGLRWTRPVRLGGVQVQRSFGLRPDLITFPLPSVPGSAAVPSTVDLFVNGVLTRSEDVVPGPFQFNNVPVSPGNGDVVVVVRDAAGRRTEAAFSFYGTPQLLREGLSSFSTELGFPRQFFGSNKSRYIDAPAASATFVHGVHDWLTVEAHAEVGQDLLNGGAGAVTRLGDWGGVLSIAASASRLEGETGYQTSFAYDLRLAEINIHAASLRTWESYSDLGVATAIGAGYRPPKAQDSISFGALVGPDSTQIATTFLHQEAADGVRRSSVTVSLSQPVFEGATVYVSAFKDIDGGDGYGLFAGFSMPIGSQGDSDFTLSTGLESTEEGTTGTIDAARTASAEPGSFGWQLHASEGKRTVRRAAANYRGDLFDLGAAVQQSGDLVDASLQAAGAIAVLGVDPFLSRRINDGFAVVDAGAPGVHVTRENRPIGVTDSRGLLLVTDIQSYNRNNVAIDLRDLPLNASASAARKTVAPHDRSGVRVSFGVDADASAALVILRDRSGAFIAPGSKGHVAESGEAFVVGYDGQTYLRRLSAQNTISVDTAIACSATFAFIRKAAEQVVIGPLTCE